MKIVLASSSPRRKRLLQGLGIPFQVIPSQIQEKIDGALSAEENVIKMATLKARNVGQRLGKGVVIAADTLVVLGKKILAKPKDKADARKMLTALSGREHQVITGLVVYAPAKKKLLKKVVATQVKFRKLNQKMIDCYLASAEYLDKAGAYAIQEGKGPLLVESIQGEYFNIVGLPLYTLSQLLEKVGISLLG